jgi:hypothetical protein
MRESTRVVYESAMRLSMEPADLAMRLRGAADIAERGKTLPFAEVELLARTYEFLAQAKYNLPEISGWVVYRLPTPFRHQQPVPQEWGICATRVQAEELARTWKKKQQGRSDYYRKLYADDEWYVTWGSAPVSRALRPDADVAEHVRQSGAFS